MTLSKLIRELSIARDKVKVDSEVRVYMNLGKVEEGAIKMVYIGELKFVEYRNNPDSICVVCE